MSNPLLTQFTTKDIVLSERFENRIDIDLTGFIKVVLLSISQEYQANISCRFNSTLIHLAPSSIAEPESLSLVDRELPKINHVHIFLEPSPRFRPDLLTITHNLRSTRLHIKFRTSSQLASPGTRSHKPYIGLFAHLNLHDLDQLQPRRCSLCIFHKYHLCSQYQHHFSRPRS
jgi:hypothetical protein